MPKKATNFIELSGVPVGRLTPQWPIGYADNNSERSVVWLCSCACGTLKLIPARRLIHKNPVRSCGCLISEAVTKRNKLGLENLMGRTFKRLTVIGQKEKEGENYWVCRCDCPLGTTVEVKGTNLLSGNRGSCGCLKHDSMISRFTTHGHSAASGVTPEYGTWGGMLTRCTNPKSKTYSYYGGRGVRVCDRWSGQDGFSHFLEDMGERPEPKELYSLDRIDNDKDYEKVNCRWSTKKEQVYNQRRHAAQRNVARLEKASGMSIDELIELYENKPILY